MLKSKKPLAGKEQIAIVTSDKMNKTIVVKVGKLTMHPVFKKTIKRFRKFKVHDEKQVAKIGDVVRIREVRPISKDKHWGLVGVVKKAAD